MLRAGVIGIGHLGSNHARVYHELENVELGGISEIDEERGSAVAGKYGCRNFIDYRELLPLVDIVSIVVPTPLHYDMARNAFEAGCHVLVEKPITGSLEQAEHLVALARTEDRILQVGHIERFNPAVVALEGIVNKPRFIESHRLSAFQSRGTDVAVVLDLMIHDIDIILDFVKSNLKSVSAVGVSVLSSHIDIANARLRFDDGCIANVTASRVSKEAMRKIRFFQDNAYISVDYASQMVDVVERKKSRETGTPSFPPVQLPEGENVRLEDYITHRKLNPCLYEPLKLELELFIKSAREGIPPIVSGEDGLKALRVAMQILDQLESPSGGEGLKT